MGFYNITCWCYLPLRDRHGTESSTPLPLSGLSLPALVDNLCAEPDGRIFG